MSDEPSDDPSTTNSGGSENNTPPEENVEIDANRVITDPEAELEDPTPSEESREQMRELVESGVIDPSDVDYEKLYGEDEDAQPAEPDARRQKKADEVAEHVEQARESFDEERAETGAHESFGVTGLDDTGDRDSATGGGDQPNQQTVSAADPAADSTTNGMAGEFDPSEFEDQDLSDLSERAPPDVLTVRRNKKFLIQEPNPDDPEIAVNVDDVMQNMLETLRKISQRNLEDVTMDEIHDEMYPVIDLFVVAPSFTRAQWEGWQPGVRQAIFQGVFEYINNEVSGFTLGRSERQVLGQV